MVGREVEGGLDHLIAKSPPEYIADNKVLGFNINYEQFVLLS